MEYLKKPPLALLEENLGQLTEEEFEILNPHEIKIKEALEKTNIRNKNKELDLKRRRLSELLEADSHLKREYGRNSDVGKLKKQIKKEEDDIKTLLTDAILNEFGEKYKKTQKKTQKKTHKKKII